MLTAALAGIVTLLLLPDHILYRQRLFFGILDLDRTAALHAFDHDTHDGLTLRSWYVPPRDDRPVIVYFPGRDGDIVRKPAHLVALAERGYGLLLVGYRGYGGNPGRPRENDIYRDTVAMLDQARAAGMEGGGYVLYGYSMGTGFATNAAIQIPALAMVLEAPISSFLDAVRQQAGRVPGWLIQTRFDNVSRMGRIGMPVLLLAGGADAVTPPWFAETLAAANPSSTRVEIFPEANHFNIIRHGGANALESFLEQLEQARAERLSPTA